MNCTVCCCEIKDYAFGPCNHKDLCANCMLHWFLLYHEKRCPSFKEEMIKIAITTNGDDTFDSVLNNKEAVWDREHNIYFSSNGLADAYNDRLGLRCPICYSEFASGSRKNNPSFRNEKELTRHCSTVHQKILCEVCLSGLKVFPYEMVCYSQTEYEDHLRIGINDPKLGYRLEPHPVCRFCRKRLYNDKSLAEHLEHSHQHCVFCPPSADAYFNSQSALMNHYRKVHYICDNPSCANQDFSVFNSRIELMEHKMAVHGERETISLSDLFNEDEKEMKIKEPEISESQITKAKIYIVEDPSGWSQEEIHKHNRQLVRDLLQTFSNDQGKLERYQKMCSEYIHGTVSAAVFHDMSINLLGVQNMAVFSRLISLISDPQQRHVLETVFREAKGRKTASLSKDFLRSVGANDVDKKADKKASPTTQSSISRSRSAVDLAWERADVTEKELQSPKASSVTASPAEVVEELPSVQQQWRQLRSDVVALMDKKRRLVEKKRVITSEVLLPVGLVALEVIRVLDETLSERARQETWPGIETDRLNDLEMVVVGQSDKQLAAIDWIPMFGVQEQSMQGFMLFYDNKDVLSVPAVNVINRAKRDLDGIPAIELNVLRETFVLITGEVIKRMTELVRDVDKEQKERFAPVVIPSHAVKESKYSASLIKEKKKESVWGNTVINSKPENQFPALPTTHVSLKENMFPPLPTKKKPTINGKKIVIEKNNGLNSHPSANKPEKPNIYEGFFDIHTSDSDRSSHSPIGGSSSPVATKPLFSRFYTPPLSSTKSKKSSIMPVQIQQGLTSMSTWRTPREDPVDARINAALEKSKKGKKSKRGETLLSY